MSKIRLFFNPLDASSVEEFDIAPGRQIIDWLQEHYAEGFDGYLRVFVGVEEIAVEDLDYAVREHDQVTLLIMPSLPAGFIAAAGTYLLQAAVAFAIGYIINLIFAPDIPGQPNAGEESSVYSLSPTRNAARLGEPVEVHYGTVSFPPSFAAVPYAFNVEESNDQYVDELLCLGQGYFVINNITVGDTPETALEVGALRWWQYGPDDHNSTMGVIEADIAARLADTDTPFPFYENVFTSPEVENWEFQNKITETQTTPESLTGDAYAATTNASGEPIPGRIENIDTTVGAGISFGIGDELVITGSTSNNITFTVASVFRDPVTPTLVTLYQDSRDPVGIQDEIPLNVATQFTQNATQDASIAGPFRCQKEGQLITEVVCDFTFPQGLYSRDGTDGNIKDAGVTVQISVQEINESTGAPIGVPVVQTHEFRSRIRVPYRGQISSGPLTPGAYEVTVSRLGNYDDERTTENLSLTAIKGIVELDTTPGATYGPVTMVAVRMKATNGLAQAARSRIRVNATRILDPNDLSIRSDNPMTAIYDVWTNPVYGLGRSLDEWETAHTDPIEAEWQVDGFGPRCNGSFDQRDTGYHAMQVIASMTGSKIINDGGYTTLVQEKKQLVRKAVFNSANVVKDSLQIIYNFDSQGEYDGIEVQYVDAQTFIAKYAYFPASPKPEIPDTMTLWGVTDDTYANQMANYFYNVKDNRRKMIKFDVELDGWLTRFGDRFGISMPMPEWGQSGVVADLISLTEIRVDQPLDWQGGDYVMLRDDLGRPDGPYAVTQGATPDIVIFPQVPGIPLYDMEGREPSSYMFGQADEIVMDFVVSKVVPKGETTFNIEGQTYADAIYDGAPPHMGGEVGYTETLFMAEELYGGFTNGQGLISTNTQDPDNPDPLSDGRKIIFNHKGNDSTRASEDFGASWLPEVLVGNTSDEDHTLTCFQYYPEDDTHWVLLYDADQKTPYIERSVDDGATWDRITASFDFGYSYGFMVFQGSLYWGARENGTGEYYRNAPQQEFMNGRLAPDWKWLETFDPPTASTTWTWVPIGQGDGNWIYYAATDDEGQIPSLARCFGGKTNPVDPFGGYAWSSRVASRNQGKMIIYNGQPGATDVNFAVIQIADGDPVEGDPFTVDFGVNIGHVTFCYAKGPDIYLIVARDATNDQIIHSRYCLGDDFTQWYVYPTLDIIPGPAEDERQLLWAYDNTYYYGFQRQATGGTNEFSTLTKIVYDQPAPEVTVVPIHQSNWDTTALATEVGPAWTLTSGTPQVTASSEYGAGALESGGGTTAIGLNGFSQLDVNVFTLEISIYPQSFGTWQPVWHYGAFGTDHEIMELVIQPTGELYFYKKTKTAGNPTDIEMIATTPLTLSAWNKVRVELDGYRARLSMEGIVEVNHAYIGLTWQGVDEMRIGYGRALGGNIYMGDIRYDNYRLSNGYRSRGDYEPATGPFPIPP